MWSGSAAQFFWAVPQFRRMAISSNATSTICPRGTSTHCGVLSKLRTRTKVENRSLFSEFVVCSKLSVFWSPTLNLFPVDTQFQVGIDSVVSIANYFSSLTFFVCVCQPLQAGPRQGRINPKVQGNMPKVRHHDSRCCFASDCFVPLLLWHP